MLPEDSQPYWATFSKSIGHSSIRATMEIKAHLDMTQNRFVQRSMTYSCKVIEIDYDCSTSECIKVRVKMPCDE